MQTSGKAFEAVVSGRVQGVGFRYRAKEEADKLKISGWVRNLNNGDVEVYAEGTEAQLTSFLGWLNKGPPWAHVENVGVQWLNTSSGKHNRFVIR
ncbi:MAG: acylphosphatase [Spirochaetaceae bacterium]|jgi:acylphosphatase|nr:acylphosphatase [Spirochaetaceae bacterium]